MTLIKFMDKNFGEMGKMIQANNQAHYKNNRMQQIRGFCNLVIFKSVTKAAHAMGLSQPAISIQIKTLERDIGKKLVEKKGKFLVPTEEGMKFYEYVMPTLNKLDTIYDEYLTHTDEVEQNTLRIAGYYPAITRLMPKAILELSKTMPHIKIIIIQCNKNEAIEKLRNGEVDVMLFNTDDIGQDLQIIKTIYIKPVILVKAGHFLTTLNRKLILEDFKGENFLLIEEMQISASYTLLFRKIGIKKDKIEFRNFDWEGIKFFVSEGLGLSFFGAFKDDREIKSFGITQIEVSNIFPMIEYNIIINQKITKTAVRKFANIIENLLKTKFTLKAW